MDTTEPKSGTVREEHMNAQRARTGVPHNRQWTPLDYAARDIRFKVVTDSFVSIAEFDKAVDRAVRAGKYDEVTFRISLCYQLNGPDYTMRQRATMTSPVQVMALRRWTTLDHAANDIRRQLTARRVRTSKEYGALLRSYIDAGNDAKALRKAIKANLQDYYDAKALEKLVARSAVFKRAFDARY